jgi:gliding motility-associated-like protein
MQSIRLFFIIIFLSLGYVSTAQTFTGTGGAIPDNGASPTCFPVTVTNVGAINNSYGLYSVCLDITHTWDADLEIKLQAPDGTIVSLAIQEGGSGDNFTGTCFTGVAIQSITNGIAPFTGDYLPTEPLGTINNGQNANGVWSLCIQDIFGSFTGTLNSWSITFNNTPAPPPPVQPPCLGNGPAGNDCTAATPVCNFNGYCGNTSATYTVNTWPELTAAFCGSLDNNSFVTFVASATTASFNVWVSNSTDGFGIQMMFYDGGCGSGAVNEYGCYNQIEPSAFPSVITATGLTPGNTYFLLFDGYAGDECDYSIAPISGVNILSITPTDANICPGQSVTLSATGGGTTYTWTGAGLNTNAGATVVASPVTTTTYTVTSADATGNCPLTSNVIVTVITTPPPPTVSTPVNLCQNATANPLTANGTSLLWYTTPTGGTGSSTAPTPNTATVGTTNYYVSQTLPCGESVRVQIVVNVTAGTPGPIVNSPVTFCQNSIATALTATGNALLWYTAATGGIGTSTAPIPSTTTAGNTTYFVSQSGSCGESPRTPLIVTIVPAPAAPTVVTPITYCLNAAAAPLTASGSNLLWYYFATGGTAFTTAPTPTTTAPGNTAYYVSQTVNGCQGPRAAIVVTVLAATPAPTVVSPVTYCESATALPLTATGSGLLWYTTPTGGTGVPTITPSTTTPGTFTYFVSQTTSCGESPRTVIVVTINPIPTAPTTSPVDYCVGVTANPLTAIGNNLLWYTTATGGTGVPTITPSTAAVGSTTYYVSQTSLGCESSRTPLVVTITGLPSAPVANPNNFTYCQNSTTQTLTATGTALLWYTTATGGTGNSTAPTPSSANAGTTIYYVTQTLICGESPRTPITVIIDTTPVPPAVVSPVVYCQGAAPIRLSATGNNLLWYDAANGGIGSATAPTPITATVGNTDYYVSATIGACEGPRSMIRVTVNVTPPAPTVNSPVTYCQYNATVPLSANGTNILWYNAATGGAGNATAPYPTTNTPGTTSYYTSQTAGVCEGPRALIQVIVQSTPNIGNDKYDTICYADSYDLTTLYNTNGLNVSWVHNGLPVNNPSAINDPGIYQIEVSNNNGCADTARFYFTKLPQVVPNAGRDTIATAGLPHQLYGSGGVSYSWSPAAPLNLSTSQSPIATINQDQLFILTVYNEIGCAGFDSVFVKVLDGPAYFIPSSFTPNGDGLNDIFRPVPSGIVRTEWFKIFDRWGRMIFTSNKWLEGWNGTYNGREQPVGTYVWIIKGTDKYGEIIERKGTVILLR